MSWNVEQYWLLLIEIVKFLLLYLISRKLTQYMGKCNIIIL